jgi:O-methyltransferase/methyltransferase family protein
MTERNPSADLMRLVNGYQITQAIHVAATLGIADQLRDGPRNADELAAASGAHAGSLYRLLRALAAVGVFHEEADRHFSLTPMGSCLRSDASTPVGPWANFVGRPYYWQAWGHLLHSVRTGESAFRYIHGTDVWTYRSQHPEESAVFDRSMTAISGGIGKAIAVAYDFSPFACVVDVGGGHGDLLAAILAAHPAVRGILFDQAHVLSAAAEALRKASVANRCDIVAGSFFDGVPKNANAYVLSRVLHNWDDAAVTTILRVCRGAIEPSGKLLVVERLIAPSNEAPDAKFGDLNMMVAAGGQERTREEFAALFANAGFRLSAVVATATQYSVIEGVPA